MTTGMRFQEQVTFSLGDLYERLGYARYKMSKFEEYDLYARNKDFLISDSVITFMDTNGKLMALKPDVTLSIVKNSRDNAAALQKVYYNETVYRVSKTTHTFRELMQVGLECLGRIDDYCICEVLTLAARSLRAIAPNSILNISHLDILGKLLDAMGIPEDSMEVVLRCIGQKNTHELVSLCESRGISWSHTAVLKEAMALSGPLDTVLPQIHTLLAPYTGTEALDQLAGIAYALKKTGIADMLRFDFSAVDDLRYYSGIVFKGFIQGLPSSVLSGGQYDRLMQKMGRKSGAIGFAVYLDTLERLDTERPAYDVDTVLLYRDETPLTAIQNQVQALTDAGQQVLVQRQKPEGIRCRQILRL